jgi:hypothetical protein
MNLRRKRTSWPLGGRRQVTFGVTKRIDGAAIEVWLPGSNRCISVFCVGSVTQCVDRIHDFTG